MKSLDITNENITLMTETIRSICKRDGFPYLRIAPPNLQEDDKNSIDEYLKTKSYWEMSWMERHRRLRTHPEEILISQDESEVARSVLVLSIPYPSTDELNIETNHRKHFHIAAYAMGKDYHRVLRKAGQKILTQIQKESHRFDLNIKGRVVCDSAPVPEKILGLYAGAGWRGRNSLLIHPELGSYFFLMLIFLNVPLNFDSPLPDRCGDCRRCEESCPAQALHGGKLDASRCISAWTIERPENKNIQRETHGWIFGCDLCQTVCPWNTRKTKKPNIRESHFKEWQHTQHELICFLNELEEAKTHLLSDSKNVVLSEESIGAILTHERWQTLSQSSVLSRISREMMIENIKSALNRKHDFKNEES